MKRITLHIFFWIAIWLFRGFLGFMVNLKYYTEISISQQLFVNFFPEIFTTLVKVALCYTVGYLLAKTKGDTTKSIIPIALIFVISVFLRLIVLSIWLNWGDHSLPLLNTEALVEIPRIMNSVIDIGFVLGIFLVLKNYRQQLRWMKREQQLVTEKLEAELNFLKAQINPHFLFNTLNNFYSMAQANGDNVLADSILKLSGMMRYTLYDSGVKLILLEKEINYINNFILLTKLRFTDEEVRVDFKYPKDSTNIFVPPMILMPFVENAFKYGISINQHSIVTLSLSIDSLGALIFHCTNNNYANLKTRSGPSGGIGLQNVKRRLELIYPSKHVLSIDQKDKTFTVNLKIDL